MMARAELNGEYSRKTNLGKYAKQTDLPTMDWLQSDILIFFYREKVLAACQDSSKNQHFLQD